MATVSEAGHVPSTFYGAQGAASINFPSGTSFLMDSGATFTVGSTAAIFQNGLQISTAALSTTALQGFIAIPTMVGAPTGAAIPPAGVVYMVWDSSGHFGYLNATGVWYKTWSTV